MTFSGGEPFCQCKPLAELAGRIKAFHGFPLNVISFTGYTYEYLIANADDNNGYLELLQQLDYLVDGPLYCHNEVLSLNSWAAKISVLLMYKGP